MAAAKPSSSSGAFGARWGSAHDSEYLRKSRNTNAKQTGRVSEKEQKKNRADRVRSATFRFRAALVRAPFSIRCRIGRAHSRITLLGVERRAVLASLASSQSKPSELASKIYFKWQKNEAEGVASGSIANRSKPGRRSVRAKRSRPERPCCYLLFLGTEPATGRRVTGGIRTSRR